MPESREELEAQEDGLLMEELGTTRKEETRRRSILDRILSYLPRRSPLSHIPLPQLPTGDGALLRTIFNYPEPDVELRSTAWLDGLRGIAAFEVFVFHYLDNWMEKGLAWGEGRHRDPSWYRLPFIRTFYASGDTAVCVFFAISGYVLSHRMLGLLRQKRLEQLHTSLSSAVFRRGIRLYMPVVIETFTLMMVGRYLGISKTSNWTPEPNLLLEIKRWFVQLIHLFIPLRYPDRWDEILNMYDGTISWTIPLEYYGSLVVYTMLLLFSRTSSMTVRLSITAGIVVSSFLKDDWIAGQFLMGMAFADFQLQKTESRIKPLLFWAIFIFGFYLAGLPGGQYLNEEQKYKLWSRPFYDWISQPLAAIGMYADRQVDRYLECLAGMCILMGVGETPKLRRFTERRFIQYLGKISFGLYLCHIFVHVWIKPFDSFWFNFMHLDPKLGPHERKASLNLFLSYILMMIPATIVNFIVAGLFERFVDKPSVNFAKAFEVWCLSKGKDPVTNGQAT